MRRSEAREHLMQMVFEMEVHDDYSQDARDRYENLKRVIRILFVNTQEKL